MNFARKFFSVIIVYLVIYIDIAYSKITTCYGHRGAPHSEKLRPPENTVLSFMTALLHDGADGIELDVRLTKDNQVVILHDTTLDRTSTGVGLVSEHDWFGDVEHQRTWLGQQRLPTLKEVLELHKGFQNNHRSNPIGIYIDIKDDNQFHIVMQVIRVLQSLHISPAESNIVIGVWKYNWVKVLKKLQVEFPIMLISKDFDEIIQTLGSVDHVSFSYKLLQAHYVELTRLMLDNAVRSSRPVRWATWTVDRDEDFSVLHELPVDISVISNNPASCKAFIQKNDNHVQFE
ncbi:hypothetical protein MIR68_001021 [Amoeboaphelidium protococcarum]|nr:hypothetical protein MIR68_001021 [Amoeboaphelidium protococcarum]